MKVLVTGGCGYIGSHTSIELLKEDNELVIVDNLSNSHSSVIDVIEAISNKEVIFYELDIRDKKSMKEVFRNNNIDVVIHFAALKSISDSLIYTKEYFDINVNGTKVLTELVEEFNVDIFIFSSSAAVYGLPKKLPINENFNLKPTNPYAETKMIGEEMCHELYNSGCKKVFILRYFNPVGAHKTALLGEHFSNDSKNLVPLICNVLNGSMSHIRVYGSDYNTNDGTGIRDYIHILDLAQGHVSALQTAKDNTSSFIETVNLGTG